MLVNTELDDVAVTYTLLGNHVTRLYVLFCLKAGSLAINDSLFVFILDEIIYSFCKMRLS